MGAVLRQRISPKDRKSEQRSSCTLTQTRFPLSSQKTTVLIGNGKVRRTMSLLRGLDASQKEADFASKHEMFGWTRIAACWAEANGLSVETFVKEDYK